MAVLKQVTHGFEFVRVHEPVRDLQQLRELRAQRAVHHDLRLRGERGDRDRRPGGRKQVGRRVKADLDRADRPPFELGRDEPVARETDRDLRGAGHERRLGFVARRAPGTDVDARRGEIVDQRMQQRARHEGIVGDADRVGDAGRHAFRRGAERLRLPQQQARLALQALALRRQRQRPSAAREQRKAQFDFEEFQQLADGRAVLAEMRGGLRDAAVFGNARERLDLRERVSQCAHDVPSGGCGGFSHMCRFASSTRALDTGFEGAMR